MSTQVAAIFASSIVTVVPAVNFSGFLYPLAAVDGVPRLLGALFPSAYYQSIALGTFAKGLGLADLAVNCGVLAAFGLGFVAVAAALLDKQEA